MTTSDLNATLPARVIEQDRDLDTRREHADRALMELRWRWTLDESNPDRVSFKVYAVALGPNEKTGKPRSPETIRKYARAYELLRDATIDCCTPTEAIHRATTSVEKQSVTEAIATARGVTYSTVDQTRQTEVRRVREIARERAEERGSTVEEEARKIAEMTVRVEEAEKQHQNERRERHSLRYIELDGYFASALLYLARAAKLAGELQWDSEEQELLHHTIEQIQSMTHRIDARLAGVKDIDWDAELEKILQGVRPDVSTTR